MFGLIARFPLPYMYGILREGEKKIIASNTESDCRRENCVFILRANKLDNLKFTGVCIHFV